MFVQRVQKQPSFNFCPASCRTIEKGTLNKDTERPTVSRHVVYLIYYRVIDKDIFTMESLILAQDER